MRFLNKNIKIVLLVFMIAVFFIILPHLKVFFLILTNNALNFFETKITNKIIRESETMGNDPAKTYLLANMYYKKNDYKKTIIYCNDLLSNENLENDLKKQAVYLLGLADIKMGNIEDAKVASEKLVEINPVFGHFLKGLMNFKMGNIKEAKFEMELALRFDETMHSLGKDREGAIKLLEQLNEQIKKRGE